MTFSFIGAPYNQNFDTLATSGTANAWSNDSTLVGWFLFRQPAPGTPIIAYNAGTGSVDTGNFYSFGASASTDRALGGLGSGGAYFGSPASGAVAGWIAFAATNNAGAPISQVTLTFDGEQWRNGGNATAQTMTLQYGFGTSFGDVTTWTPAGGGFNWTSPVATATAAAVDGNVAGKVAGVGGQLTLNQAWTVGATLWFRWVENNDVGNDHGLAIDNFSLAAVADPPPTVTINQAASQPDPTSAGTVLFDVTFSEPVSGFDASDVVVGGTAGATTVVVSGGPTSYQVSLSGMTQPGSVTASIPAGVVSDGGGQSNSASTSFDNTVVWLGAFDAPPTVTINQAATQVDPATGNTIVFDVAFSEPVAGFDASDVILDGTAGATTVVISGGPTSYQVSLSGMTQPGTVIARISAGAVTDAGGQANLASTSSDNTVTWAPVAISLSALGTAYTQNFDALANTGLSNSGLPVGWSIVEAGGGARDNELYAADDGNSNTGDAYSYGTAGSSERALGGLRSGTLVPTFGAAFTNDTGATIEALRISFVGEQWRLGTEGRTDRLELQYSLNATGLGDGLWTAVPSLNFVSPSTAIAGALVGNSANNQTSLSAVVNGLSIPAGSGFRLRWVDVEASGADDGLAIDDFSITPLSAAMVPPQVSVVALDADAAEAGNDPGTFRISRTGDTGSALVVAYTLGGNAGAADYTPLLGGSVTIAAGQAFVDITITPVDDAQGEGLETVTLTLTAAAAYDVGSAPSATVSIADNDTLQLRIRDIQGAGHISPLNGQAVANVPGIVTAVATNGFYLQDPEPDADSATSEGIFVFTNSAPTVAVGDSVRVTGTVFEFRPGGVSSPNLTLTEITSPVITKLSSGNALPDAIVLGAGGRTIPTQVIENDAGNVETGGTFDPAEDGIDFWESLEGMRVQINNPVATSPTAVSGTGSTSEEIWVLADGGANASSRTARGGSLITANDFNPERIQIDDLINGAVLLPTVDVGATLSTITGVVSYSSSNFEVLVSSAPTVVTPSPLLREVTSLLPADNVLRVATFNVENLDPGDGAAKFNAIAQAIVTNLKAPEIINLEEVQDNNGRTNDNVVDASVTLQTLIDAIKAAGGPTYEFRQINPLDDASGGEPGGNIRVAFLFDPARVSFVDRAGGSATVATTVVANGSLSVSPGLIDPANAAFADSRKPLVGEFSFNGQSVFVIGNHFNSKGGDQPLFGVNQPPALSTEAQRLQQATIVKNFVQELNAKNPGAKVIVAGDLNDFEFSNPVGVLESGGLTSLIETLPAAERYTYNFEGNAQALDHLMASNALMPMLTGYDVVHINSEFATQVSDHDPVVASFLFGKSLTGGSGRDLLKGTEGNDVIAGGAGRDLISGLGGSDRFVFSSMIDFFDTILGFQRGADKIDIRALLASVGYSGANPFADGIVSLRTVQVPLPGGGGTKDLATFVLFDADGSGTEEQPRLMVQVIGVALDSTDFVPVGGV